MPRFTRKTRKTRRRRNKKPHRKTTRKYRAGADADKNECEKKFCEKRTGAQVKKLLEIQGKTIEILKKMPMEGKTPEQKKQVAAAVKNLQSIDKKKVEKGVKEGCLLAYCNPGCKGTIFEDGKKLPISVIQKFKNLPNSSQPVAFLTKMRENIFKGKESVLKDSFYEGLKNVDELKKQGATSGCSLMSM